MLTKRTFINQIILEPETGAVGWKEVTVIEEDGVELTRSLHSGRVEVDLPDADFIPPQVKPLRSLYDTPELRQKALKKRQDDGNIIPKGK